MLKIRNYTVLPALPEVLNDLQAIAVNLFWSWNPELIDLFSRIDPAIVDTAAGTIRSSCWEAFPRNGSTPWRKTRDFSPN